MKDKITVKEALEKAQMLCGKQEKCTYDILQKLREWRIPSNEHDALVSKLKEDGFIDEERYCKAYVIDKIKFNKWGKLKIRFNLKGKNIPESIIDEAFCSVTEEFYMKMIEKEVKEKKKTVLVSNQYEMRDKIMRFAQSRGYEFDIVDDLLHKL